MNGDEELGKFISLILRHKPEVIGISLDENGWADVESLIRGINKAGKAIDKEILSRIVRENNKKRYSYNEDCTKIRANQGHSLTVDVNLKKAVPPPRLYHGTATRFIESIKIKGIIKGNRQHVHLSEDKETAFKVGKRHGKPIVLVIDTREMMKVGYTFYLSENNVWLCEDIPWQYVCSIKIENTYLLARFILDLDFIQNVKEVHHKNRERFADNDMYDKNFNQWELEQNQIAVGTIFAELPAEEVALPISFNCLVNYDNTEESIKVDYKVKYAANTFIAVNSLWNGHKFICVLDFSEEIPSLFNKLSSNQLKYGEISYIALCRYEDLDCIKWMIEKEKSFMPSKTLF